MLLSYAPFHPDAHKEESHQEGGADGGGRPRIKAGHVPYRPGGGASAGAAAAGGGRREVGDDHMAPGGGDGRRRGGAGTHPLDR